MSSHATDLAVYAKSSIEIDSIVVAFNLLPVSDLLSCRTAELASAPDGFWGRDEQVCAASWIPSLATGACGHVTSRTANHPSPSSWRQRRAVWWRNQVASLPFLPARRHSDVTCHFATPHIGSTQMPRVSVLQNTGLQQKLIDTIRYENFCVYSRIGDSQEGKRKLITK